MTKRRKKAQYILSFSLENNYNSIILIVKLIAKTQNPKMKIKSQER
jgi:hypothetical protein